MSWQSYVDDQLLKDGKVQKAAILGQAGGVWAASPGYTLSPQEQAAAVKAFDDPDTTRGNGVRLAGQKFITISVNDRSVNAKKGPDGCVLVKTKQAVLVAEYQAPIQQPEAAGVVEKLADYLISVGY